MNSEQILTRLNRLEEAVFGKSSKFVKQSKTQSSTPSKDKRKIDYSLDSRAFVKRYGTNLKGPQKFTLLVALLSKGNLDAQVSREDIFHSWNKLSGLLGGKISTGVYGTRAKEQGLLNSKKSGWYNLSKEWSGILS